MALADRLALFGTDEDISAVASTVLFTNQIDLGGAGFDPGNGQPLYLNIVITAAVVGTSSTINFRLRSDDTASIHATTSTAHFETGTIAEALLTLGARFSFPIPVSGLAYERYLGLQAVIGTATTTAGTATAWLGLEPLAKVKLYADATN